MTNAVPKARSVLLVIHHWFIHHWFIHHWSFVIGHFEFGENLRSLIARIPPQQLAVAVAWE